MSIHRRAMLVGLGGVALLSAGCMTKPLRAANADGTYCYRIGKSYRPKLTCTPGPIPSERVEAEAHQFSGAPDQLTIYLVRKRWGDTGHVIRVATPSGAPVDTIPDSFARWRLPPGQHTLTLSWPEGSAWLDITGRAGDVLAVEIVGQIWAWGSTYRLEPADPAEARERAGKLRLVADVR